MVHIKYYKSKSVSSITSYKILNDLAVYTLLYPGNKILTVKWTLSVDHVPLMPLWS